MTMEYDTFKLLHRTPSCFVMFVGPDCQGLIKSQQVKVQVGFFSPLFEFFNESIYNQMIV